MPTSLPTPDIQEVIAPDLDEAKQEISDDSTSSGSIYRVILYNDDHHDIDEVMVQVQKATGCPIERAESITIEAHFTGRAVCFKGQRSDCQRVCRVLREIRLQCEIDCD